MSSKVSIAQCKEYDYEKVFNAVKKAVEALGGLDKYIKNGDTVALKPNLLLQKSPQACATTHPIVVKAVANLVKEVGGKPIIVESPGGPYTTGWLKSVYKATGMNDTDCKLNYDTSSIEIQNPKGKILKKLEVLEPLVKADVIINISKFKSHGQMVYTGAVKNMFGSIPGVIKAEYHFRMSDYTAFSNVLVDIYNACNVTLNIMDAITGMEGEGPSAGDPRDIGVILCSEDAFALDTTILWAVGADSKQMPLIERGIERKICSGDIKDIEILGDKLEDKILNDFSFPALNIHRMSDFSNRPLLKMFSNILRPRPVIDRKKCVACGICARDCPAKVIDMSKGRPEIDLNGCIRCFCCQELCPKEAIKVKRRNIFRLISGKTKKGE